MLQKTLLGGLARPLLLASVLFTFGCASSIHTYRVRAGVTPPKTRGVYYALPRTIVSVTVPVVLTQLKAGDFCDLTPIFFPDVESPEYGKAFKLGDVTMATRGEADPEQVFLIDIKGHLLEDKKLNLSLTPDGVMSKVDVTSTNHTGEFISQAIKSAGAIVSKIAVASLGLEPPTIATSQELTVAQLHCKDLISTEVAVYNGLPAADQAFYCKSLNHRERMVYGRMDPYVRESFRQYVTSGPATACVEVKPDERKPHFLQGLALYNEIADLRRQQGSIAGTSGLVPNVTPDYLKLLASRVEDPLQADLNQFFGQQIQKTWNATYELDAPNTLGAREQQALLFAWSKAGGVCKSQTTAAGTAGAFDFAALSVHPPPADFIPVDCSGSLKYLTAGLAKMRPESGAGSDPPDTAASRADRSGLFYRIPAKAQIQVYAGTIDGPATAGPVTVPRPSNALPPLPALYFTRTAIAQIGKVASLPETTGGRKTQYTMDLYADSGAIQNLAVTSDAVLDKSMITDVEGAATSVSDALTARKKAAHTDKELEELKRQHAIMDEKVAIKAAEDTLKPPAATPPPAGSGQNE